MASSLFDRPPPPPVPWRGFDLLVVAGLYVLLQIVAARLVFDAPPPQQPQAAAMDTQPAADDAARWQPHHGASQSAIHGADDGTPWAAIAAVESPLDRFPLALLRPVVERGRGEATAHLMMKAMIATSAASLLTMILAIIYLKLFRGATWTDLGLRLDFADSDIAVGVGTFLVVAIPIYTLHYLANIFFETDQAHPIIEAVLAFPGFFWMSLVTAVIVAPVVEEFFFRGLLLGWLDSLPTAREIDTRGRPQLAWWPVLLTSFGFALMHLNHGAAPVALLFFSIVLGWLYQRYHRLMPCIALHASLNGTSLLMLAIELTRQGAW